jgi:hypothetical protein
MTNASPAERLLRPIVLTRPIRLVEPNSWASHIPFAYWIVDRLRPRTIVELGTHSGNSFAAFVQATQILALETVSYAIDTWLGDAHAGFYDESTFIEWSRFHEAHFRSCSRLLRMTFDEARALFAPGSIDLLHIDGYHTYDAVRHDFETWRDAVAPGGVVLCHDVNVRESDFGAWRFWDEIRGEYPTFTFTHGHGLGVLTRGIAPAEEVRWLTSLKSDDEVALVRNFFHALGDPLRLRLAFEALDRHVRGRTGGEPHLHVSAEPPPPPREDQGSSGLAVSEIENGNLHQPELGPPI